jgi:hypothetical protein
MYLQHWFRYMLNTFWEESDMRKFIIALVVSAAVIVSGVSITTFTSGELTGSAWAEGGE